MAVEIGLNAFPFGSGCSGLCCLALQRPSFLSQEPPTVVCSQSVQGEADTPGCHSSAGESEKQGQQSSPSRGSTSTHHFPLPEADDRIPGGCQHLVPAVVAMPSGAQHLPAIAKLSLECCVGLIWSKS